MAGRTSQGSPGRQRLLPGDLECVRSVGMFDGIDAGLIDPLFEHATVETYAADTLLFSAGDLADRFFVVVEGRARLFALTAEGKHTTITFVEPGMTFAEGAIFGMRFFPINADVKTGTRLIHVPRDPFVERLLAEPELPLKMLAALARWQGRLVDAVAELKTRSPSQRFAAALLAMTDRVSGPAEVPLQISKSALANRIGIAPESMSRVFTRMRDIGVIVDGGVIRIRDVSTLRDHISTG
ncbi:MAG: Crp/Fnr family transcriptional regulator [Alphaproteobacteria bacterium]|nr:Crp/Fnr family transcriptional regulator [Alphaproteobacteria bacterium]